VQACSTCCTAASAPQARDATPAEPRRCNALCRAGLPKTLL
jgi:hypothetical protein